LTLPAELHRVLHDRFGLGHLTIRVEPHEFKEVGCVPLAGC
jgi:hypothetical protein